jgi:hypothetical protein
MLTLLLDDTEDKHEKPFRYFYYRIQLPQLSAGTLYNSQLINLPTEYKYVSGMWVTIRPRKGDSPMGVIKPVNLAMAVYDITGMIKLDYVPVDLLYRDGGNYNHNKRFFPVNFNAGGSVSFSLKAFESIPQAYVDIVMLLSDKQIEL